jgi:hypothetical protein
MLVIEFKYEPSHRRDDIWPNKFPVVQWVEVLKVLKDIARVKGWVAEGRTVAGLSLFVDEGRYFRSREAPGGAQWEDWAEGPAVLVSRA